MKRNKLIEPTTSGALRAYSCRSSPTLGGKMSEGCPFKIGDIVRFTPSERTAGHYQDIQRFGIRPGEARAIKEIRDDTYLYFEGGAGGWPWNEFAYA